MAFLPFSKKTPATPPSQAPLNNPPKGQTISTTPSDLSLNLTGEVNIQDILAPPSIEVDFTYLKIGNTYIRTLFVAGYPRYVSANWLSPLINFDHSIYISMFIYPI